MTPASIPIPRLGLGTSGRSSDEGFRAILAAIELGYRHIDTAQTYGTEAHIGRALRESGVSRQEFFITTKVADTNLGRRELLPSLRHSLERLAVDQVDLTLIHWPAPPAVAPLAEYIDALAEARALGLTKLIGVSNFPCAWVEQAVALLGPGELATNQVELHPYLQNLTVQDCCRRHGISVTAYMPLAGGRVASDPILTRLGTKYDEPGSTVALAWLMQRGMVAIPASGSGVHMKANLRALNLTLQPEDLALVDALDRGERHINPPKSPRWD